MKKDIEIIKSILGEDFLEKSEITGGIMKLSTNTAIDPQEINIALQIVPRSILTYLFVHLKDKKAGDIIDLDLPFSNASLHVNKYDSDNYSGYIHKEGKKISDFKYRSLPGIGLILMSTLELYDFSSPEKQSEEIDVDNNKKIQDIIEERIKLRELISDVVDRKISEKEAIKELVMNKINQQLCGLYPIPEEVTIIHPNEESSTEIFEESEKIDKKNKLKSFLEDRKNRQIETIEIDKSEICCPDCRNTLYKNEKYVKLCICYGEYFGKKLKLKKKENKITIRFPKSFGNDNIDMLLDAFKQK
jgi:hypothetical protein